MANILAVAYYPEHVAEAQWPSDLERMRQAGITAVRVFEFAWGRMELRENVFDFAWVHRFMQLTQQYGIDVILCTPTAAQPPWLMLAYPDTVQHNAQGQADKPGFRRNYCFSSPRFRDLGKRITRKMIDELQQYSNITGWQIDNELGFNFCKCAQCRTRYQQWLQGQFGDIQALNAAWGLVFWSAEYTEWSEVDFGMSCPESKLAERRFFSDLAIDFLRDFSELLHTQHPGVLITTNFMGNFDQIDYFQAAQHVDVIAWDFYYELYTAESTALAHDLMRSLKGQQHWTLENSTGCLGHWRHMDTAMMVMLGVKAWAHGEALHTKFPWRAFNAGFEQIIWGLVDHADRPTRSFTATQQLADLYAQLPEITMDDFVSDVAVIHSYANYWGFGALHGMPNYAFVLEGYYKSMHRLGVGIDVQPETVDFSRYKVLLFPSYLYIDDALAEKVRAFVAQGGTVIITPHTFSRDRHLKWQSTPAPAGLTDVFGAGVREGCFAANYLGNSTSCLGNDAASVSAEPPGFDQYILESTLPEVDGQKAVTYFEWLEPQGAEVWARYTEGLFAGEAAITAHRYGDGLAIIVGCGLPEAATRAVYRQALEHAAVAMAPAATPFVEIMPLRRHRVYLNHNAYPCREPLPAGRLLLGAAEDGQIVLPAYGVAVVEIIPALV